jgi:arylsulfatase A-like enzyme
MAFEAVLPALANENDGTIVTDFRYFIYFAWQITRGAVPHVDFFHNKTRLASFAGLALALVGATLLVACGDEQRRPNVLLITVDTLRADHLGAYGSSAARTPNIDRLAREGSLFEQAAAPMPLTRPTHASILTARYPREHGVVNNAISLPDASRTLAEILRAEGYRTGAFVAVALLSAEAGFAQGFETYRAPTTSKQRPADEVVPEALDWLAGLPKNEPFFLWTHVFDPHLPYAPPAEYRDAGELAVAGGIPEVSWPVLREIASRSGGDVPASVLRQAKSLYRGEIAYADHWIGRLLEEVDRLWGLDDTMVVLTADHGECFEDGVYFEHSDCLSQAALRVPLIVRYPPEFAGGARRSGQASSIDVAPTVLHALGLEGPADQSGRPLQDLDPDQDRYVLVQHPLYQSRTERWRSRKQQVIRSVAGEPVTPILVDAQKVGIVGPSWKYLRSETGDELYALDPTEEAREPSRAPDVRAELAAELDRQLEAHPLSVIDAGKINDELLETLRALGYLPDEAAAGASGDEAEGPPPE